MTTTPTTINSREAARVLGKSAQTVRRLADRGILPTFRLTPTSPREFRLENVLRLVESKPEDDA